jgi:outer membrane protein TolC
MDALRDTAVRAALAALLLPALGAGGCASYETDLSARETDAILSDLDSAVVAQREAARTATPPPRAPSTEDPVALAEVIPEVVDLRTALGIASRRNRDLQSDREGLVLSALSLISARNDIGPRLSGTIRHALAGRDDAEELLASLGTVGATATLPTGAEASITATTTKDYGRGDTAPSDATAALTARISQPLLRGAGYDSSHERLTDAQRQALYDVRQYDLSRQDLALVVLDTYYGIVAQKQVVRNREAKLESLTFLVRRSERLFELGRVSEVDKFRAAREYLTAENDLVDARQELEARLDRFKVLLGLDTAVKLDVVEVLPEPKRVDLELTRAIDVALANRLDLMNSRDQVEDAERRERIREQDVLPDVRLELSGTRRDDGSAHGYSDTLPLERDSWGAGVVVELPLDRVRERNALRAARIEVSRARRELSLAEDRVIVDVRGALRNLRSAESSLKIQEQITASEEKNVKIARLRFEEGTIGNRDLTDALSNLADAQDRLVREKANAETARVRLLRAVGTLNMNEDGTWRE